MNSAQIFFLSMALSLVVFGLIAWLYIVPWARQRTFAAAVTPVLLLHSFRFIGLAFLMPGVVAEPLPPAFSTPAAYGDLGAALLALLAIGPVQRRWRIGMGLVWLFNVVGTVDLVNAIFQGYTNSLKATYLGTMFFVPTVVVPGLLVTHVVVFWLLLSAKRKVDGAT